MGSDSTFAILKPTVKKDQTASIFVLEFKIHFESRKIMLEFKVHFESRIIILNLAYMLNTKRFSRSEVN